MLKSILIEKDRASSTWYLIYSGPSYIPFGYFLHSITCIESTYIATFCSYEHTVKDVNVKSAIPISLVLKFSKRGLFNSNTAQTKILSFITNAFDFNFEFNSTDSVTIDSSTVHIPSYDFSRDEL